MARDSAPSGRKSSERKANQRGAARLAAVQALYQMDIAGTGINDILAEFESHWMGQEVEGNQYLPAEAAFFREVVGGVVREHVVPLPVFKNAEGKEPVYFDGHPEPYIELVKELTPPENAISVSTDPAVMFRIEGFWDAPSEYEAVA